MLGMVSTATQEGKSIGDKAAKLFFDGTRNVLDSIYRHSALVLVDAIEILGMSVNNVPLVGFTYEAPSSYTLLRYDYSEFPYLNKQSIISGYVKNNTELTVTSHTALMQGMGILQVIGINTALLKTVETYCDKGGRFGFINVYDAFASNLVLQELKIIPSKTNRIDDVGLEWTFKKLLFSESSVTGTLADSLNNIANGVPA